MALEEVMCITRDVQTYVTLPKGEGDLLAIIHDRYISMRHSFKEVKFVRYPNRVYPGISGSENRNILQHFSTSTDAWPAPLDAGQAPR